jgi:hypothetical protein
MGLAALGDRAAVAESAGATVELCVAGVAGVAGRGGRGAGRITRKISTEKPAAARAIALASA